VSQVLYGLGVASQLYREFIKEGVNYRREYARFGVQALVAGWVFHQMDTHKNNELSAQEVHATLQQVLGEKCAPPHAPAPSCALRCFALTLVVIAGCFFCTPMPASCCTQVLLDATVACAAGLRRRTCCC
jgi:hypothetical protein